MNKAIVIAVSVVATLLGSTTSVLADTTPQTCGTDTYNAMQDYVATLLYWHRNPTWYPTEEGG
jgi:hypothetical protein